MSDDGPNWVGVVLLVIAALFVAAFFPDLLTEQEPAKGPPSARRRGPHVIDAE